MSNFFTLEECFRVLGLDPNNRYTAEQLKKAYREQAMRYHPDKNPDDPFATSNFQKIKEAYEIITNPSFRFKKHYKSTELNIIINFSATFDDGFFGKKYDFNFNTTIDFKNYRGDLNIDPFSFSLPQGSAGLFEKVYPDKGFRKNDNMGDLLVRVNISNHPQFIIQGKNVISEVPVPLSILLKGGFVDVATMYGIKQIKVSPGTNPESTLKIPNCGVGGKNYHIAKIRLKFPSKEELKNPEWNSFGINWSLDS